MSQRSLLLAASPGAGAAQLLHWDAEADRRRVWELLLKGNLGTSAYTE